MNVPGQRNSISCSFKPQFVSKYDYIPDSSKGIRGKQNESNQKYRSDSLLLAKYTMLEEVIVQELGESRGGRPGLSVLTSLLVSVDVKNY